MSIADEIRAKVDEAFKSPEFIGYLMSRREAVLLRERMSDPENWEGAFGHHMRSYVDTKLRIHRRKRAHRELDMFDIRPDLQQEILAEIHDLKSYAAQHRASAVDEALGRIID